MKTQAAPPLTLGAGITGLSAAWALQTHQPLLLERNGHLGGLASQYTRGGYLFDFSGHYFHFQNKEAARQILEPALKLDAYQRDCRVFLQNRLIPYPIQLHLSWLKAPLRQEVCQDLTQTLRRPGAHLRAHLQEHFGEALCQAFFFPFMAKYTRYPLELMAVGEDRGSIPAPPREAMIRGCQGGRAQGAGYNAQFFYSRKPLAPFFQSLAAHLGPRLHLEEEALRVDWRNRRVHTTRGSHPYGHLISTLPLPELLRRMEPSWPEASALRLPHTATLIVNGVLARRRRRFHWVYLPDPQTPYYRAGYYPGRPYTAFYLEQTLGPGDTAPDGEAIRSSTLSCLRDLGMLRHEEELLHHHAVTIPDHTC